MFNDILFSDRFGGEFYIIFLNGGKKWSTGQTEGRVTA